MAPLASMARCALLPSAHPVPRLPCRHVMLTPARTCLPLASPSSTKRLSTSAPAGAIAGYPGAALLLLHAAVRDHQEAAARLAPLLPATTAVGACPPSTSSANRVVSSLRRALLLSCRAAMAPSSCCSRCFPAPPLLLQLRPRPSSPATTITTPTPLLLLYHLDVTREYHGFHRDPWIHQDRQVARHTTPVTTTTPNAKYRMTREAPGRHVSQPWRSISSLSSTHGRQVQRCRCPQVRLHENAKYPFMSARPASRTPNDRRLVDHVQLQSPNTWVAQVPSTPETTWTSSTVDPRRLRGRQVSRRDPEHLRKLVRLRM
ncbi:hypothetical protein VPH35_044514 [Triticum aestivum]